MGDPAADPETAGHILGGTWTNTHPVDDFTEPKPKGVETQTIPYRAHTDDSIVVKYAPGSVTLDFDEPVPGLPAEITFGYHSASPDRSTLVYLASFSSYLPERAPGAAIWAIFTAGVDPNTRAVRILDSDVPGAAPADPLSTTPVPNLPGVPDIQLQVVGDFNPDLHSAYVGIRTTVNQTYRPAHTAANLPRSQEWPPSSDHMQFSNSMTLSARPVAFQYSWAGYDITQIGNYAPRAATSGSGDPASSYNGDVTAEFGAKNPVFRLRGEYAWYTGSRAQVPEGLFWSQPGTTVSHAKETVFGSASEASDETSWTVSAEGGEKGEGGQASFGMSTMNDSSRTQSSLFAITDTVSVQGRLTLDKPNASLDQVFESVLRRFIQSPTQTQAENIRDTYGTHYANSLGYGGRALNIRTVTQSEFAKTVATSIDASAGGSAEGVGLSASYSNKQSQTDKTSQSISGDDYTSWGSTGSMDSSGFHASIDTEVPVLFDLQPLDGLISPLFFPDVPMSQLLAAKAVLRAEIDRYVAANRANLDTRSGFPDLYRVDVSGLTCTNANESQSRLYGDLTVTYYQGDSPIGVNTWSQTSDATTTATCNGQTPFSNPATYFILQDQGDTTAVNWSASIARKLPWPLNDNDAFGQGVIPLPVKAAGRTATSSTQIPLNDGHTAITYSTTVTITKLSVQ